jgi:murein DD-endopeptidase MepM/ murein hydrolase activator NlpD
MPTFPLSIIPTTSWHNEKGSRNTHFGALRSSGTRAHGACDLFAPPNTPVLAVANGTVWYFDAFYKSEHKNDKDEVTCSLQLYELVVVHADFIIRYGEIAANLPQGVGRQGTPVTEGQTIGFVGQNCSQDPMLHLEMYSEVSRRTDLTDRSHTTKYKHVPQKNYERRDDLMDPTPYLDRWAMGMILARWQQRKQNVVNVVRGAKQTVQQGIQKLLNP